MKSFKRGVYKVGEVEEEKQVPCSKTLQVNGESGIYEVDITIGTDTGVTGINYQAYSQPDRFQLFFDGNLVADSKFVGGQLDYYRDTLLGSKTLSVLEYNDGVFVDTGTTEAITITEVDLANGTAPEPTAGQGVLTFSKNKSDITVMKLRVTGIIGTTLWNVRPICPTNDIAPPTSTPYKQYDFTYQLHSSGDCVDIDNGVIGAYYSDENLEIGMTIYTDKQLLKKVKDGEYWLGRTIYKVEGSGGKVIDAYPCSNP